MIEMLGVLAVIGVLSAGGIMGYSAAMNNYRVNQTIEDIQTMVSGAKNLLTKPSGTRKAWTSKQMKALGLLPSRYKIADPDNCTLANDPPCRVKSLFGKDMLVRIATQKNNEFTTFLWDLPTAACVKIVTYNWNNMSEFYWWGIYKNGAYVLAGYNPPTLNSAKNACEGATYLDMSLYFNYRRGINIR